MTNKYYLLFLTWCFPVLLFSQDSTALVALYNATNGPEWSDTTGWLSHKKIGEWHGVTVIGETVQILDLSFNNLSGHLPEEIGELVDLEKLALDSNLISGNIPLAICTLEKLRYLALSLNSLTGSIPDSIGNLDSLTWLNLSQNPAMEGTIPVSIGDLDKIVHLTLSNIGLTGEIPSSIGNLTSLTNLRLIGNNLEGSIPSTIGNLVDLTSLFLDGNKLSGYIPSTLDDLTALTGFNISQNNLSGNIPSFELSPNLSFFNCAQNYFTFEDIAPLIPHPNFDAFIYSPQKIPAPTITGFSGVFYDSTIVLSAPSNGGAVYSWYQGTQLLENDEDAVDSTYTFTVSSVLQGGEYTINHAHPVLVDLSYTSEVHEIFVFGVDSLGGEYVPNQLIVEFDNGTTYNYRDSLRQLLDATLVDSCKCGTQLQVWEFDSLEYYPLGIPDNLGEFAFFHDPNEIKDKVKEEFSCVDNTGFNYITGLDGFATKEENTSKKNRSFVNSGLSGDSIKLAIIDTGIRDTFDLVEHFWVNPFEDGNDSDGNCIVDFSGFDFVYNDDPVGQDNELHASQMAAVARQQFGSCGNLQFQNIQAFDTLGRGDIFDAICAIHYAIDQEADVINMSWSYYGQPISILENALLRASANDILTVASAGNGIGTEGVLLDTLPFYPASFDLPNMISVAAAYDDGLAGFSNRSDSLATVAAPGVNVTPWNGTSIDGTSGAAAFVSGLAATYRAAFPDANVAEVKTILAEAITPFTGSAMGQTKWNGQLKALDFQLTGEDVDDLGNGGSATIENLLGGIPPYDILWSNGEMTEEINNLTAGTYTVTVTDETCHSIIDSITVSLKIATQELLKNNIQIYPNPTTGLITIDHTSTFPNDVLIKVYNTQQQLVIKKMTNGNLIQMNLFNLPQGIYFVHIFQKGEWQVSKILKL